MAQSSDSELPHNTETGIPDWEQIGFNDFPPIQSSGAIKQLGRQWFAGQTPDQFLTLEDLSRSLAPEEFSLAQISQISQLNLDNVALSEFSLATNATLEQLKDAVPHLSDFPVKDIEPISFLAAQIGVDISTPLDVKAERSRGFNFADSDISLGEALAQSERLADSRLIELGNSLSSFSISEIPNLDKAQLQDLAGWEKNKLSEVPGLSDVPLNSFPNSLNLGGAIMRIDMVYGTAETSRDNTISGGDAPVKCADPDQDCAYIELDDLENSGRAQRGASEGKQWISGKYQAVKGGSGCLQVVNGGKEPTGRFPFGDAFKVVVMEPDETTDEVDTALFFRFCTLCGCTPYFLGPIPFLSYSVNDNIFIGMEPGGEPSGYSEPWELGDPPASLDAQLEAALAAAGVSPCPAGFSAKGGGSAPASFASGKAVDRAIAAAPAHLHKYAAESIPRLIAAAKAEGVTDPAQVAYILATAETETLLGRYTHELSATRHLSTRNIGDGAGSQHYGRGLVQLTGEDNYRKASHHFGVDFVNNPDLAASPEYDALIAVWGMKSGVFTGRALSDYIDSSAGLANFVGARWIVNDQDKASQIAADARRYYQALKGTDIAAVETTTQEKQTEPPETTSDAKQDSQPNSTDADTRQPEKAAEAITQEFAPTLPSCSPTYGGNFTPGDGVVTGNFVMPTQGHLTSPYGWRIHPLKGTRKFHKGIDLAPPKGTAVVAADGGEVIKVITGCSDGTGLDPCGGGWGNQVWIRHSNGLVTQYNHLAASSVRVRQGMAVSQGQQIAGVGSSGYSTGPHLDFMVRKNGKHTNPAPYLPL
ncbi:MULTISPECIES: peptidoglycan DD-metalloendopeptidase family protein [unclassified Coleofasciculus]|uniref:peptidoglycan DD-metalloendopeptidase family protein n=1 Tax=unclassified Coleofasciculus TaxID=2692782 RepID=UPI00187F20E8|nr:MULTISPECIES: peptidoglycan DD-metalloendopeptidase family protein [unclassified Coleofasciculus]MBE9148208.1 M23 family metallopeptidase [Coleofasciculus sp. LEGE 07092]